MRTRLHLFWFLEDDHISTDELRALLYENPTLLRDLDKLGDSLPTKLVATGRLDCLALALRLGSSPDGGDGETVGPLVSAVQRCDELGKQAALLLLACGAKIERSSTSGNALRAAVLSRCLSVVQLLIGFGGNINMPYEDGYSALHIAVSTGQSDMVKMLLEKGADQSMRTLYSLKTPFDMADAGEAGEEMRDILRQHAY